MGLLVAIFISTLLVLGALVFWRQLGEDDQLTADEGRAFKRWVGTGLAAPFVLWIFFNLGMLGPSAWPSLTPMSAGFGKWYQSFDQFTLASGCVIATYWAGVTFVWLLARVYALIGNPRGFFGVCAVWSLLLGPAAAAVLYAGGWPVLGLALTLWGLPLVHLTLNLKPAKPLPPTYSRALAKISFGHYDEAEAEIIRELEACEEDFDGWMMLAELYATHFNDLPGAHQTIRDLCAQPTTTPSQVSVALHKLADWHLKIGRDPLSAREALEDICRRMSGTHLGHMARQRINQLPASRRELDEMESGKPMPLPHVPDEMDVPPPRVLSAEVAAAEAGEHLKALQKNPDDVAARENFARVLAENLGQADAAVEQLQLLLAMPNHPRRSRAGWLLLIAGWHARYRNDLEMARLVYEQVTRDFSDTPQAFNAQIKLHLLTLQARARRRAERV